MLEKCDISNNNSQFGNREESILRACWRHLILEILTLLAYRANGKKCDISNNNSQRITCKQIHVNVSNVV